MISEDAAFVFCTTCRRSFYVEIINEEDTPPLPKFCAYCASDTLEDLEYYIDEITNVLPVAQPAEVRGHALTVIKGGKSQQQLEDQNGKIS